MLVRRICVLLCVCALGMAALGAQTAAPMDALLADFETPNAVHAGGGMGDRGGRTQVAVSTAQAHAGTHALAMTYDFSREQEGVPTPPFVYGRCQFNTTLPGRPTGFSFWLYADANALGFNLTYRFMDATGRTYQCPLTTIGKTGWQQLSGAFDPKSAHWGGHDLPEGGLAYPLSLAEVLIDGGKPGAPTSGTLYFDDLRVQGTVTPQEAVTARISSSAWVENMGTAADPGIAVQLMNYAPTAVKLPIRWTITDFSGRVSKQGRWATAQPNGVTTVPLPMTLSRGYLTIAINVGDAATLAWPVSRTITLGRIPPVDAALDLSSPFGVNGHTAAQHMKPLGVGFTRTDWPWRTVQSKEGVWDYSWCDRLLDAIHQNGLEILPVLGYNPPWLTLPNGQGTDHAAFLDYVRRTVEHYKGRVRYWDLWNEPNGTFPGGRQEFGDLSYEAYKIIKAVDPQAIVVYPGCGDDDFHSGLKTFTIPSLASFNGDFPFDVLAVHPYTRPLSPDDGRMREKLLDLRVWLDAHGGKGKPIWITEGGWATATDRTSVSEPLQAAYLARYFIIGLSAGVQKIVYYQPFSTENLDDAESQFGFLRNDYTPKPAAIALAQVAYRLKKATFLREVALGNALRCYLFRTPTQTVATVYAVGQPVDLHVTLPKRVTLEAVDGAPIPYPGGMLKVGAAPIYLLVPNADSAALQNALQRGRVSGIVPVHITGSTLQAGRYLVQLRNALNRPVQARVTLKLPAEWRLPTGGTTQAVTVPANGDIVATFPLATVPGNARAAAQLTLAAEGSTAQTTASLRTLAIPHAPQGATLDDLRGWMARTPTVALTERSDVMPATLNPYWKGPQDLSAATWWAWNEQGLYLLVDVRDDVHCNTQHGTHIFAGDGIQIALNTDSAIVPGDYDAASREFGCALTDTGAEVYTWVGKPFAPGEATVQITRDDANKHTSYAIFASWQGLGLTPPAPGTVIALNMIVNEDDGPGRQTWLEYAPGIAITPKNPALFPRAILQGE